MIDIDDTDLVYFGTALVLLGLVWAAMLYAVFGLELSLLGLAVASVGVVVIALFDDWEPEEP